VTVGLISAETVKGTRQLLAARKSAFQLVFSDGHGKLVVEDLTEFARAGLDQADVFYDDPRKDSYYAGRASILKRIRQYLELPLDDLLRVKSPEVYNAMMAGTTTEEDDDG
jgi:hypothetical protein